MRIFTQSSIMLASALAIGTASADAKLNEFGHIDLTNYRYQIDSKTAFTGRRADNIEAINAKLDRAAGRPSKAKATDGEGYVPDVTFGPKHMTGDLDGPNGERWFFTATYDYTVIPPDFEAGVWFTDYILKSYQFEIYDPQLNHVGTIKDTVEYADDEVRVPSIELAPVVSRNFFNTDDNIEVLVSLVINTSNQGTNRYASHVYSLGKTDSNGDSKPIMTYNSLLGDVVEGPATADGKDNFYMSFAADYYPEYPAGDDASFWDYATGAKMDIDIYGRALDDKGPRKIMSKEIKLLNLPGDQESAAFMMSFNRDGEVCFVFSYLEEPLWERYDDPAQEDMVQRENNTLNVDFYKTDGTDIKFDYTTKIATERDLSSDQNLATFYSIGGLKYKLDIDFDHYGSPKGRAALVVKRENYNPSSDSTIPSFFVYDYRGRQKVTLAENCDGNLMVSDIPGYDPQHIFIYTVGYNYYFSFVNMLTGEEELGLSSQYEIEDDEEPEGLRANLDRVAVDGSYMYAIELQAPLLNDNEDNIMRIMWIDKDGNFDHFDGVNMGKNVQYAQVYIESKALDPKAYHSDDTPEYLLLIKRGNAGSELTEELLLGQATDDEFNGGKDLLYIKPTDERGIISGIVPDFVDENPNLSVYFVNGSGLDGTRYTQDIYKLPLDLAAGIDNIVTDNNSGNITITGTTVSAQGAIHVYTAAGSLALSGKDTLELSSLQPGVYIVAAAGDAVKAVVK